MLVFKKRENRRIRGKTSRSKGEKQQPTQPLHGVDARIRTRAALVGEECSYHYRATLAPLTGSLRRPADQQARRLWVRDWEEQRKKSASEAVDKTSEVVVRGGGGEVNFFSRSLSQTTARLGSLAIFLFCLFLPVLSLVPNVSPRL